ncbi:hypothetical protein CNEO4_1020044 [Clostridium neonatale]|uniref:Uncharacterized protein n=1 Tax=Clostridium neonatale TaxID=137838 RepID=A0AA86MFD4_9CLOT|nr:hypothetical protein CNEO_42209 [Clostridium neonatale]CAG9713160.1 hypothetical protein CNEO_520070 [Clostridium neonatale]CAI3193776.1 hypothetical protein CNEO2_1180009 [Clostridium neonatale]CAI3195095.1 hypothetical protein CNEO2_140042 [Clostridium neonatale]CAI3199153.1 hypothetical protein CNEO2_190043 [Clostridium neonatale]
MFLLLKLIFYKYLDKYSADNVMLERFKRYSCRFDSEVVYRQQKKRSYKIFLDTIFRVYKIVSKKIIKTT